MFRYLTLRRIRVPERSRIRDGEHFDQFDGSSGHIGLGFSVTSSVPVQHQYHSDPSSLLACRRWHSHYSSAHGAHCLDCQNHWLRTLAKQNPLGARATVGPSLSFEFILTPARNFAAPVQAKPKPKLDTGSNDGPRLNEAITAPVVRLVTDEGHSIITRREALDHAKNLDLDLVEVQRHAKPPVCKIMDFHKEKFKQEVKEKERAKSKSANSLRNGENKEVRFKGKTELKDLKTKADQVIRLMERGYRVKCIALPTGSEGVDTGELLLRLIPMIEDVSVVESGPHIDAKQAYLIVRHVKFASKKSGKKMCKVMDVMAKGLQAAASGSSVTDAKAPQSEDELEPVGDSSVSEDEAQEQERRRSISTPPKPIVGLSRSGLDAPKESPPVTLSNRYSKRTEMREGSNQFNAARNPGQTRPTSGPPSAARNPGWRPPNSVPRGAARNPGWRLPNSGPPVSARHPDSGGEGRYGGAMSSGANRNDSPSKSYGVFSKVPPGERRPTSPTPVFGNIGNKKPASSSGQKSGDSPGAESSSPVPPTRKYGIFSSAKNASSGN